MAIREVIDPAQEVAEIIERAVILLGSEERASAWMDTRNTQLNGLTPNDLLDIDMGRQLVQRALDQLDRAWFARPSELAG